MTIARIVLCPIRAIALTAGSAADTASVKPARSDHVGLTPMRLLGSATPSTAGAALKPQLPITTLVQPWATLNSMPG